MPLKQESISYGGVAQLGEHLPCKQGVRSSILLISTSRFKSDRTDRVKQSEGLEIIIAEKHERVQREKGLERRMPMSNQKWAHSSGG